ncbi:hypothetical protein IW150_000548 [Coemansia sp. RSA 2607]|nr:hypothetical protein IW150_000548 [Coemansia sp. RSA 2607]
MANTSKVPTVLVTNDDGPLSDESPFIESFIETIQRRLSWNVRVCIPSSQRSWIAKAFLVNQDVTIKEYRPTLTDIKYERGTWYTATGTPASCVNIALHHLFSDIDLVISGPNLGSNVANTCALASGTLGAAMEAGLANKKAIALSFAFYNHDIAPDKVQNANDMSCKIIEKLWKSDAWQKCKAPVFNINVPISSNTDPDIFVTTMGRSHFGSLYRKIGQCQHQAKGINPVTGLPVTKDADAKAKHLRIAVDDGESSANNTKDNTETTVEDGEDGATYVFSASVSISDGSGEGTDMWAVHKAAVSITPLKPELYSLGNAGQESLWTELGFTSL